jgi:hypothetical protein
MFQIIRNFQVEYNHEMIVQVYADPRSSYATDI